MRPTSARTFARAVASLVVCVGLCLGCGREPENGGEETIEIEAVWTIVGLDVSEPQLFG